MQEPNMHFHSVAAVHASGAGCACLYQPCICFACFTLQQLQYASGFPNATVQLYPAEDEVDWMVPRPYLSPDPALARLHMYKVVMEADPRTRQCLIALHFLGLNLEFSLGDGGYPYHEYLGFLRKGDGCALTPGQAKQKLDYVLRQVHRDDQAAVLHFYQKLRVLHFVRKGVCDLMDQAGSQIDLPATHQALPDAKNQLTYLFARLMLLLRTGVSNAASNVPPPSAPGAADHRDRFMRIRCHAMPLSMHMACCASLTYPFPCNSVGRQWKDTRHLYAFIHESHVSMINLSTKPLLEELEESLPDHDSQEAKSEPLSCAQLIDVLLPFSIVDG